MIGQSNCNACGCPVSIEVLDDDPKVIKLALSMPCVCDSCGNSKDSERYASINRHAKIEKLKRAGIPADMAAWLPELGNNKLLNHVKANKNSWLLAVGPNNTCKTRSCCTVAGQMVLENKYLNVLYYKAVDLVAEASELSKESHYRYKALKEKIYKADLVIIDDLCRDKFTQTRAEFLYTIINHRYEHNQPMWFTTTFGIDLLSNHYTKTWGPDIASRITRKCTIIDSDPEKSLIIPIQPELIATDDKKGFWYE